MAAVPLAPQRGDDCHPSQRLSLADIGDPNCTPNLSDVFYKSVFLGNCKHASIALAWCLPCAIAGLARVISPLSRPRQLPRPQPRPWQRCPARYPHLDGCQRHPFQHQRLRYCPRACPTIPVNTCFTLPPPDIVYANKLNSQCPCGGKWAPGETR